MHASLSASASIRVNTVRAKHATPSRRCAVVVRAERDERKTGFIETDNTGRGNIFAVEARSTLFSDFSRLTWAPTQRCRDSAQHCRSNIDILRCWFSCHFGRNVGLGWLPLFFSPATQPSKVYLRSPTRDAAGAEGIGRYAPLAAGGAAVAAIAIAFTTLGAGTGGKVAFDGAQSLSYYLAQFSS